MTENGDHVVDGARGPAAEPVDAVVRVDLHRSRQVATGAEVHPDAALLAARLARAVDDPAERPAPVPVAAPGMPHPSAPHPGAAPSARTRARRTERAAARRTGARSARRT